MCAAAYARLLGADVQRFVSKFGSKYSPRTVIGLGEQLRKFNTAVLAVNPEYVTVILSTF